MDFDLAFINNQNYPPYNVSSSTIEDNISLSRTPSSKRRNSCVRRKQNVNKSNSNCEKQWNNDAYADEEKIKNDHHQMIENNLIASKPLTKGGEKQLRYSSENKDKKEHGDGSSQENVAENRDLDR